MQQIAGRPITDAQEAEIGHPAVVVDLGQVATTAVRNEHDHHGVRAQVAAHFQRSVYGRARRPTDQNAFAAGDRSGRRERVAVRHRHDAVDDVRVVRGGPEILADPLDQVRATGPAGVDRPLGVGADDLHVGVLVLQVPPHPRDRAARADAGDEVGHPAGRLLPDLGAGRRHVRRRILGVVVLAGLEPTRRLRRDAIGHRVVGLGVVGCHRRGADDDLGTVGPQQADLLLAHLVGHDEDAVVAAAGGDDGQPDPGVARRRFDDRSAGEELAVTFRCVEHGQRRPVLHRAPGIEQLEFRDQLTVQLAAHPVESDHRGVADQREERVGHLHRRAGVAEPTHLHALDLPHLGVGVELDQEAGVVELPGYIRRSDRVASDHPHPAGQGPPQLGEGLGGHGHPLDLDQPAGSHSQPFGKFRTIDAHEDIHAPGLPAPGPEAWPKRAEARGEARTSVVHDGEWVATPRWPGRCRCAPRTAG